MNGTITPIEEIFCELSVVDGLSCELTPTRTIECEVSQSIGVLYYDHYYGSYKVVPAWNDQELKTKNLVMDDDLVVDAIGMSVTQNPSGGNTVCIGG